MALRDVRDFRTPSSVLLFNRTIKQLCGGGPLTYGTTKSTTAPGRRQILRSQRSESMPTEPTAQGVYYRSTPYVACFVTTTPQKGRLTCKQLGRYDTECSLSPTRPRYKWWEEYWWDESTDWGAWDAGLRTDLTPDIPDHILASARNRLLGKLKTQDFNAAVFAGELKDTVGTVASIAGDALRLLRSLRHPIGAFRNLSLREARRTHTRAAQEYLRFMYGVRPLMNDIYSISNNMTNGWFNTPIGSARVDQVDESFNPSGYGSYDFPKMSNIDKISGSWRRGVKIEAFYKVSNPTIYQLENYGLLNPAALAWELTTLSFVVDWFTGIGNFLSGLSAGFGLTYISGYETRYLKIDGQLHHKVLSEGGPDPKIMMSGDEYMVCGLTSRAMRRIADPGFLPPPIYLRVDLNLSQALSSLALLTSALSKK